MGDQADQVRPQPASKSAQDKVKDDLLMRDWVAGSDDSSSDDRDHRAAVDDEAARSRDDAADARDRTADARDRAVEHESPSGTEFEVARPPSGAKRQAARRDRDDAARDRAAAKQDRARSRGDRGHSKRGRGRAADDREAAIDAVDELIALLGRADDNAEDMFLVGQAQGLLMASRNVSSLEALLEVGIRAARDGSELGSAAQRIIDDART